VKNTGLTEKLLEGYFTDGISDRTVVNDSRLTAEATFNMAIQAVVARVQLSANKPERDGNWYDPEFYCRFLAQRAIELQSSATVIIFRRRLSSVTPVYCDKTVVARITRYSLKRRQYINSLRMKFDQKIRSDPLIRELNVVGFGLCSAESQKWRDIELRLKLNADRK